jgi:RNA polymerase sigma factor for flagellar operon FliA
MEAALRTYRHVASQDRRDRLVLEHLGYVRHVLGRMVADLPSGVDIENLEAAALLGLVEAAGQFDPARGVPFLGFATHRIRGAVIDELRRNCPVPQATLQRLATIRDACRDLEPAASRQQVADRAGMTVEEVDDCLHASRLTQMESFPQDLGALFDSGGGDPQHVLEEHEQQALVAQGIESLPEQERIVLTLYYLEELRLKEIGEVIGLSESRVSRILARAETRLRAYVQKRI